MSTLPAVVQRYFDSVLPEGQPMIRAARLNETGTFLRSESSWEPFEAREVFITDPVSFEWDARIRMAPLVAAHVRDGYFNGHGSTIASVLGFVRLFNERNRAELDSAALQRYVAEAIWFPTALLPGDAVTWSSLDRSRALATVTDARTTVSVEFTFAPTGEITEVFTHRYRLEHGEWEETPWGAFCERYENYAGIRIPTKCDVYWKIDDQVLPYWIGEVTGVEYDFDETRPVFRSPSRLPRAA